MSDHYAAAAVGLPVTDLPVTHLQPLAMQKESPPVIVYERLQPAHLVDSSLVGIGTDQPLELQLPGYDATDVRKNASGRRAAMQKAHGLVFSHQMFPVIPRVPMSALPIEIWQPHADLEAVRGFWTRYAMPDHYAPLPHTDYINDAAPDYGLGIFGRISNPLESVIRLTLSIGAVQMLLHYVFVVCLQFYLVKRGCFMRVRTDAQARHFSDALPPYVFAIFRRPDCAMCREGDTPDPRTITAATVRAAVHRLSFPSFLLLVFRWMQHAYPETAPSRMIDPQNKDSKAKASTSDAVLAFCNSKLAKNFVQALTCTRFREFVPTGMCDRLHESMSAAAATAATASADAMTDADPAADAAAAAAAPTIDHPSLKSIKFFASVRLCTMRARVAIAFSFFVSCRASRLLTRRNRCLSLSLSRLLLLSVLVYSRMRRR